MTPHADVNSFDKHAVPEISTQLLACLADRRYRLHVEEPCPPNFCFV